MSTNHKTIFVIGATGFIGQEVVKALIAEYPRIKVLALARNPAAAANLKALGAVPIEGDLLIPGPWQKTAAEADGVAFVAQPRLEGRISNKALVKVMADAQAMLENFFAALTPGRQRIIAASGHTYFGETGDATLDETMVRRPVGFGTWIEPLVELLEDKRKQGYDLVTVFPGTVYGNGSWFKQFSIDPILAGKKLFKMSGDAPWVSPIHVHDVGRAIAHLLFVEKRAIDEVGRQILIVGDEKHRADRAAELLAQQLRKKPRYATMPKFFFRAFAGKIMYEYMTNNFVYSNRRLRQLGFVPRYSTLEDGVKEVAESL